MVQLSMPGIARRLDGCYSALVFASAYDFAKLPRTFSHLGMVGLTVGGLRHTIPFLAGSRLPWQTPCFAHPCSEASTTSLGCCSGD